VSAADLAWRVTGACVGSSPTLFFPERGESLKAAKAVCATCAVRAKCAEWGIAHELFGVWGGLAEADRRRIRKERGISVETPQEQETRCGTPVGYRAHRRSGEPACAACRRAHSLARVIRKAS